MSQLTHTQVSNTKQPGRYFDDRTGLHLLVKSTNSGIKKYWVFRYRYGGHRRDRGLGSFPKVTLAKARVAAREARVMLDQGEDPLAQVRVTNEHDVSLEPCFEEFARNWVETKRHEWSNEKHYHQWINTLTYYCFPVIGTN